jgi:type IX secretion system PorP/SprF family membrane protein
MIKHRTACILPLLALLTVTKMKAQQNSLFNTYSFDPLQLNIAYAGASCTEANLHYRSQWIGLQNAPKLLQLNAHTVLSKSNALGLRISSQSQGLLNTLGATFGYSYRFHLNKTDKVHLGLGIGLTQASLLAQKAIVIDGNDAAVNTNSRQNATGFDTEFGALFLGKKLKAGISALHLYNSNPNFSGSSGYKSLPQLNTFISYSINKDKKIELEPWLLNRYTLKGDNVIEGMLNVNLLKTITVGLGYRSKYGLLALAGIKLGNLKLAYSFDYGANKNAINLGTSHQLVLGFTTCKIKNRSKPDEEPIVTVPTPNVEQVVEPASTTLITIKKEEPLIIALTPTVEQVLEPASTTLSTNKKIEVTVVMPTPTIEPVIEPTSTKLIANKKEEPIPLNTSKIESSIVETTDGLITKLNKIAEEIVFDLNKAQLTSDGLKRLDTITLIFKNNPTLKVHVVGHTCNIGNEELNQKLSVKRSVYTSEQLIKRGVNPKNIIKSIGVGAENALFDNTGEKQLKNRTLRFKEVK